MPGPRLPAPASLRGPPLPNPSRRALTHPFTKRNINHVLHLLLGEAGRLEKGHPPLPLGLALLSARRLLALCLSLCVPLCFLVSPSVLPLPLPCPSLSCPCLCLSFSGRHARNPSLPLAVTGLWVPACSFTSLAPLLAVVAQKEAMKGPWDDRAQARPRPGVWEWPPCTELRRLGGFPEY